VDVDRSMAMKLAKNEKRNVREKNYDR